MNGWDFFTWLCAVVLGASAVVIFRYFVRDASSILNREMHGEEPESSSASAPAAGGARPAPPEELSG